MNIALSRMRESASRIASSEIFSPLMDSLITKFSLITAPFIKRIERRYAPFAASAIPADRFPVMLKPQILSLSSSAPGSTFYTLDPLSDISRTIFEFDAIGLAAGEKLHPALIDECHVPQIQHQVLPRCLQGEQLSELLDTFCFNSATEREDASAIG
jgi:hypothetical protein